MELQRQRAAVDSNGPPNGHPASVAAEPTPPQLERLLARPAFSLSQRGHLAALLRINARAAQLSEDPS